MRMEMKISIHIIQNYINIFLSQNFAEIKNVSFKWFISYSTIYERKCKKGIILQILCSYINICRYTKNDPEQRTARFSLFLFLHSSLNFFFLNISTVKKKWKNRNIWKTQWIATSVSMNEVLLEYNHIYLFIVMIETQWPTKPKIFNVWLFKEKVPQLLV